MSVGHQYIGAIFEYLQDKQGCPPKVYRPKGTVTDETNLGTDEKSKGIRISTECDVQSFFQALCVISLTSKKQTMMIDEWEDIWNVFEGAQNKAVLNVFHNYQNSLKAITTNVVHRNLREREIPFDAFNPTLAESSVSV